MDDARELRVCESLRSVCHVAGGAADLRSEVLPIGGVRGRARVNSAEVEAKLLSALTNMGFRRGESKKVVAALGRQGDTRRQGAGHLAALLRQALAMLVP